MIGKRKLKKRSSAYPLIPDAPMEFQWPVPIPMKTVEWYRMCRTFGSEMFDQICISLSFYSIVYMDHWMGFWWRLRAGEWLNRRMGEGHVGVIHSQWWKLNFFYFFRDQKKSLNRRLDSLGESQIISTWPHYIDNLLNGPVVVLFSTLDDGALA